MATRQHHFHNKISLLSSLLVATTLTFILLTSSIFDVFHSPHQPISTLVHAESIPSYYSKRYVFGQDIAIKSRKLSSYHNVPYEFHSLPFCRPKEVKYSVESFGDYMLGDRFENTIYHFPLLQNVPCARIFPSMNEQNTIICPTFDKSVALDFMSKIKDDYHIQFTVDNLPIAYLYDNRTRCGDAPLNDLQQLSKETTKYTRPDGFPLGCVYYPESLRNAPQAIKDKKAQYFVNNHFSFLFKYNKKVVRGSDLYFIVGAEVYPSSIRHESSQFTCDVTNPEKFRIDQATTSIPFSYSVTWLETDLEYPNRWNAYLKTDYDQDTEDYDIHHYSLINSSMTVLFLTGIIAMIMYKILKKDLDSSKINDDDIESSLLQEQETGWKLLSGDVFRIPKYPALLSVMVGSGLQLVVMFTVSLILTVFGFASPESRGRVVAAFILCYLFTSAVAGFWTLKIYKMLSGTNYMMVSVGVALFVPTVVTIIYGTLNTIMWMIQSSMAQPFFSIFTIYTVWFVVSIPLVFLGAMMAQRSLSNNKDHWTVTTTTATATTTTATITTPKVYPTPRNIPPLPLPLRFPYNYLIAGILPFTAFFVEFYFLISSIWLQQHYFLFEFLFTVFLILLVTSAETTIVFIYFQLCHEDYRWWWNSFFYSSTSACYLFIAGLFYYSSQLSSPHFYMTILYFGYLLILCFLIMLLTGSVGFLATFYFVRKIYSMTKVD
ncbi:hypothetical protein C9374_007016 [Naegleria lovaniensis]|uniref:Transmembrane 9 superfamily member n=1 Tax=Naegleria lovaniensis TaxID=51637 RepID=A0AA88GYV1_NAELO|nr:uncharacterized protein C9374_007016 [Naegleria lovaniensis]KAG2393485.1 hypothetical protein C9374_007016 [Naegleria lovaniensis]